MLRLRHMKSERHNSVHNNPHLETTLFTHRLGDRFFLEEKKYLVPCERVCALKKKKTKNKTDNRTSIYTLLSLYYMCSQVFHIKLTHLTS